MNFLNYFYIKNRNSKLIILLSVLGLLPFFFGLIDQIFNKNNLFFIINVPKYYGSIILTFLGAAYWGIIFFDSNKNLITEKVKTFIICWSIIPSLWSFLILIFSHNITSAFKQKFVCYGNKNNSLFNIYFNIRIVNTYRFFKT